MPPYAFLQINHEAKLRNLPWLEQALSLLAAVFTMYGGRDRTANKDKGLIYEVLVRLFTCEQWKMWYAPRNPTY